MLEGHLLGHFHPAGGKKGRLESRLSDFSALPYAPPLWVGFCGPHRALHAPLDAPAKRGGLPPRFDLGAVGGLILALIRRPASHFSTLLRHLLAILT